MNKWIVSGNSAVYGIHTFASSTRAWSRSVCVTWIAYLRLHNIIYILKYVVFSRYVLFFFLSLLWTNTLNKNVLVIRVLVSIKFFLLIKKSICVNTFNWFLLHLFVYFQKWRFILVDQMKYWQNDWKNIKKSFKAISKKDKKEKDKLVKKEIKIRR